MNKTTMKRIRLVPSSPVDSVTAMDAAVAPTFLNLSGLRPPASPSPPVAAAGFLTATPPPRFNLN